MKQFLPVLIIIIFLGLMPPNISAHIIRTDGSIGALLHIDPDDNPIAGENNTLNFYFNDSTKKLSLTECSCMLSIAFKGDVLYSGGLFEIESTSQEEKSVHVPFHFPQKGVYTITVTGKPKTEGSFNAFSLEYDQRVERESENAKKEVQKEGGQPIFSVAIIVVVLVLFGVIFLGLLFLVTHRR